MPFYPQQLVKLGTAQTPAVYTPNPGHDHRHTLHGDLVCNHSHAAPAADAED